MSYDVSIGESSFNYTYNLSKLFYEHIIHDDAEKGGIYALHGLTGKRASIVLASALEAIHRTYIRNDTTRRFREAYDAENGWGSTDGAILFLARIMAACHASPRNKVHVA